MMLRILIVIFALCCLKFLAFAKVEIKNTYRAAVVEYYSIRNGDNPDDIFNENANNYVKFVQKASEHNADIIVFPESGLTDGRNSTDRQIYPIWSSYIPDPELSVNPCIERTNTLEAIKIVSCAARNHSIYAIVNLSEKVSCNETENNCSRDGYLFYNTNVVFDRNGSIVARYRKFNLFGEIGFNETEFPDITTFETDFGVIFGVFTAFDIIFREPSLTLVHESKVTDFVYNLHWFSALPFMTAVQTEMAWSYTMDVNLLASGYNRPISGSGGSGIFAGRSGTVVSKFPESGSNILLVADVPIKKRKRTTMMNSLEKLSNESFSMIYNMSEIVTTAFNKNSTVDESFNLRRDNLEPYTTFVIDPDNDENDVELCDRGLCCQFYSKTWRNETQDTKNVVTLPGSKSIYYRYRFAVFNGVRDYSGIRTGGIQTCAIFACTGNSIASCGLRLPREIPRDYKTIFWKLKITGIFPNDKEKLQIVETLTDDSLLPLQADEISLDIDDRDDNYRTIKFQLIEPQDDLLTFAIYGRNFTADGSSVTISHPESLDDDNSGGYRNFSFMGMRIILISWFFIVSNRF